MHLASSQTKAGQYRPFRTNKMKLTQKDLQDPFTAGQMVGMLVILTFIEKNSGIPQIVLDQIKDVAANNAQEFLKKPAEDIYLMVDNMVSEISK